MVGIRSARKALQFCGTKISCHALNDPLPVMVSRGFLAGLSLLGYTHFYFLDVHLLQLILRLKLTPYPLGSGVATPID